MRMDDVDVLLACKLGDFHSTQNAERVPYRNVKDILFRKKIEAVLPVARRPQGHEYIMAALLQAAAQIDYVALGPAVISSR
jgi:preprotein translocase subunit Sss1